MLIMIENLLRERGFNRILPAIPIKNGNKVNWVEKHKIYQHQLRVNKELIVAHYAVGLTV